MKYDEALKLWGAMKIAEYNHLKVENLVLATVSVELNFDEGYACCGGSDPDCYCSFAESPSSSVLASAKGRNGRSYFWNMGADSFDFVTMLEELLLAGDGSIMLE